jgi:disulfide bond formation protein DsbB
MSFLKSANAPLELGFLLALSAIGGALLFQYVGGLEPCVLCLQQRTPYYVALPILAIAIVAARAGSNLATGLSLVLTAVAIVVFSWGIDTGVYHAGAEWGFWPGPQSCARTTEFSNNLDAYIAQLNQTAPIDCTKPAIRILGLSLAGWNVAVSAVTVLLLAFSAKRTADRVIAEIKA